MVKVRKNQIGFEEGNFKEFTRYGRIVEVDRVPSYTYGPNSPKRKRRIRLFVSPLNSDQTSVSLTVKQTQRLIKLLKVELKALKKGDK